MRLLLGVGLLGLLAGSCGRSFCLGPLGDKSSCYTSSNSGSAGTISSNSLYIQVPTNILPFSTIPRSSSVQLTGQNGVGSYTWMVYTIGGGSTGTLNGQSGTQVTGTTVTFQAPNSSGTSLVQVQDSNRNTFAIALATQ